MLPCVSPPVRSPFLLPFLCSPSPTSALCRSCASPLLPQPPHSSTPFLHSPQPPPSPPPLLPHWRTLLRFDACPFLRQDYCYSGDPYRGTQSMTKGGIPCQAWASQFPHTHNNLPATYPDAGLDANYCRNPSGVSMPWCYTIDTSKRWDYCVVDTCPKPPSAPPPRAPPAPPCELLVLTLCAPQNGPQTCTSG